ncbi:MAG: exosortase/archaeosortase family protein [Gemmatimonadales bacterium]
MVAPTVDVATRPLADVARGDWTVRRALPWLLAAAAFVVLFADPARGLARDWWTDPDAGHGLLLTPVALWLAWKAGSRADATPSPTWGTLLLLGAVLLRALGSLAAEFFTQRFSIWLALVGLTVFVFGWRQVRHWWLPFALLLLSIPLPALITNKLAIPLQFRASQYGTMLIKMRHIPVVVTGNVIQIAGQEPGETFRLFVAEACSGLRSLTALLALGVMIGGMYLRTVSARVLLLLMAIPVAVAVNAVRIFLTAFLMYFVDPELGRGFMHESQGWALFVVSFAAIGLLGTIVGAVERFLLRRRVAHA